MSKILISNQSIGDFYGLHRNTISAYKNKAEYKLIYEALKAYYIAHQENGNI